LFFYFLFVVAGVVGVLGGGASPPWFSPPPRLALACYHKPDDLVRIPDLIAGLGLAYRWYLQCSTMTPVDTVLFGVPVVPPTARR
ncbi:MAG: hypothetical protein ACTHOE_14535, partial [Conexibacter sp.]